MPVDFDSLRAKDEILRLMIRYGQGLDLRDRALLASVFAERALTGFGIGTNLTNDTGMAPLNIVMKLIACNGQPVAKLSDAPGKTLCKDETFLAYLRQVFQYPAA
jgi:nicotinate phosphoribosyltransferase